MAKTSTIDIIAGLEGSYWKALNPGDRYTFARVRRSNALLSAQRKKGVSQRSLLPEISEAWALLSEAQKEAWGDAAANCNLNGWRLFIQDYCARRINDLSGPGTPSNLWQSWVGRLNIAAPATELKIIQIHPRTYYVMRKVTGKKSMYAPVLITEDFGLPFTIGLNYKSALTAQGAGAFAKFYALIWYCYQGQNLQHELAIDLDLNHDWQSVETTLTALQTYIVAYDLYIHLYNVRGDLYVDNFRAEHSGQNWVRDPFCKDINQGFTRNFYQIPKHWSALVAPEGALFESGYYEFS